MANLKPSNWMLVGTLLMALSVALGAFGAHALRSRLEPRMLEIFQTGVHYQTIHAIAIIAFALAIHMNLISKETWIGAFFLTGILFFSGSLYALSLTGVRALGAITPIGGVFFLVAWLNWAWALWKK